MDPISKIFCVLLIVFGGYDLKVVEAQTLPPGAVLITCGEYDFIDPGGEITIKSPNFPNNYSNSQHCLWAIHCSKTGAPLHLIFRSFDMEPSLDCKKDSVLMRNGMRSNSPVIAHICGSNTRRQFVASNNQVRLEMNTNNNVTAKGFDLLVKCLVNDTHPTTLTPPTTTSNQLPPGAVIISCGEFDFIDPGGDVTITSPNYPRPYDSSSRCRWAIQCSDLNATMVLNFTDFQVQLAPNCTKDVVILRDGHRSTSPMLGHLCGNITRRVFTSSAGRLRVDFDTDSTVVQKGFQAKIHCNERATTSTSTTSTSSTSSTSTSSTSSTSTSSTSSTSTSTTTSTTPAPTTTPYRTAMKVCKGSTITPKLMYMINAVFFTMFVTTFDFLACCGFTNIWIIRLSWV